MLFLSAFMDAKILKVLKSSNFSREKQSIYNINNEFNELIRMGNSFPMVIGPAKNSINSLNSLLFFICDLLFSYFHFRNFDQALMNLRLLTVWMDVNGCELE